MDTSRLVIRCQSGDREAFDIPVGGSGSIVKWKRGMAAPVFERVDVSAPVQWSAEGGLGLEYHVTLSVGIYVEPSVRYYFDTNSRIRTIRQDKPVEFAIPFGIRIDL